MKKIGRQWKEQISSPDQVLNKIKPGLNIFLGSVVGEPRTLMTN